MNRFYRCVAVMLAVVSFGQAPVDEQAIVRAVDAGNGDAMRLLEKVVDINSGTQNVEGVRKVG